MNVFPAENKSQQPVGILKEPRYSSLPTKNKPSERRTLGDVTNQSSLDNASASSTAKDCGVVFANKVPHIVTENKESETVPIVSPSVSPTATTSDAPASPPGASPAFQRGDPVWFSVDKTKNLIGRILEVDPDDKDVFSYMVMLVPMTKIFNRIPEDAISPSTHPRLHPGNETMNLYWDTTEAFKLFCPYQNESVWDAIDAQIKILDNANLSQDGWMNAIHGGSSHPHLFSTNYIKKIQQQALYLSTALKKVKHLMPDHTWTQCCNKACEELAETQSNPFKSGGTLTAWYADFRRDRKLKCPQLVKKRMALLRNQTLRS